MSKHAPFIVLVMAIIAVFYAGITPSFSADDYPHLLKDIGFKNTWDALDVFLEFDGREYRPMVRMSVWLNHLMSDTATPFKITNLFLHLLVTTTIYIILSKLSFSKSASAFGAAIFGLHPIHTASMHFIMGRTDLVAAVFYFGTIAMVADWKDKINAKQYFAAFLLFVCALSSKEISITLPIIMLGLLFHNRQNKNLAALIRCLKIMLPFILVAGVYVVVRLADWSQSPDAVGVYTNYNPLHILSNYGQWMFGLLYPFDLYLAQDWALAHKLFFGLLAALSVASICLLVWKKNRTFISPGNFWLWFAAAWIFVTLLPISGGNPHRWYLYIPSFGLSLIAAGIIDACSKQHKKKVIVGISILLGIYAIETTRLSLIWHKQSEISEAILKQIGEKQLYKKDKIYVANIPFGYKSAYLFTFNSLEQAIEYRFGKAPVIEEINYVNLDDTGDLKYTVKGNTIHFGLTPTHYKFVLLSALERRFEKPETRMVGPVTITIDRLANNKKISDYTLVIPEDIRQSFYYFDQLEIKTFSSN